MLKLELLLRRIRGFDAKRMMVYVRDVKKETKTPTPVIMADMLYCILRYNVGFYDYHIFGFAHIHGAKARNTFFTMQDNWRLTRMVNSPEDRPYFENKLLFCRTFAPYLGRSFLDLNEAGEDALADFLRHHPVVFLKEPESFGGLGVKRFDI